MDQPPRANPCQPRPGVITRPGHTHPRSYRAALPDVRLHDLRHSFASVAIRENISLMVIGKLLGHALAETTTRYAHLSDEIVADAAERVSGSIARLIGVGQ